MIDLSPLLSLHIAHESAIDSRCAKDIVKTQDEDTDGVGLEEEDGRNVDACMTNVLQKKDRRLEAPFKVVLNMD